MQALLESAGYRTRAFASGPELLRAARDGTADCLILDYAMPEMDGLGVMAALRKMGCRIPTVVFTAHASERIETMAREAGAICMLEKPVTEGELLATLERAMQVPSN